MTSSSSSSSHASLKKLALNGALWTLVGYGSSQFLRLLGNLILTWLLAREYFGLMALVQTFITGLELFSDVGLGPSVIQNKRGDEPRFLNTAWTLQVMRSLALWLGCFAIAYPASHYYNDDRLLWLLPVVGFGTVLAGFNSTALFTLRRHMQVGKATAFELGTQVIFLGTMILWALISPSIWALVGGALIGNVAKLIISHLWLVDYRHRFAWNREDLRELFTFGRWIFLSTVMTFFASQTDRLMFGKLVSIEMLGVYSIAYTLSDVPRQVVARMGSSVIFPLVSRQADLPRVELRDRILSKRWLVLAGSAVLLSILTVFGDQFILHFYKPEYHDAAWMLVLLAFWLWHTILYNTMGPCLLGIGRPFFWSLGNGIRFIALLIGVPLGHTLGGIAGVVLAIALSDLPTYLVILVGLSREKLGCAWQDLCSTGLYCGFLGIFLGLRLLLGLGLPTLPPG